MNNEDAIQKLTGRIEAARKSAERAIVKGEDPAPALAEVQRLTDEIAIRRRVAGQAEAAAANAGNLEVIAGYRKRIAAFDPAPFEKIADDAAARIREAVDLLEGLVVKLRGNTFVGFYEVSTAFADRAEEIKEQLQRLQDARGGIAHIPADLLQEVTRMESNLQKPEAE